MTQIYRFTGVECVIGRPSQERRLLPDDTIELTEEEYLTAVEGGAALEPAASPWNSVEA